MRESGISTSTFENVSNFEWFSTPYFSMPVEWSLPLECWWWNKTSFSRSTQSSILDYKQFYISLLTNVGSWDAIIMQTNPSARCFWLSNKQQQNCVQLRGDLHGEIINNTKKILIIMQAWNAERVRPNSRCSSSTHETPDWLMSSSIAERTEKQMLEQMICVLREYGRGSKSTLPECKFTITTYYK